MDILGVGVMVLIFVAILFGGHFFIYFSLVRLLNILAINMKIWLAATLGVLSVSFIAASVLADHVSNLVAEIFYLSSGIWLGIGWNLALAFVIAWIIVGAMKLTGTRMEHRYLAITAIVFTAIFSGYGVWSAYHPKIKNITVAIKDLPEQWKGKKAIQLSDVHLGHVYREEFLASIVAQVNAEKPDIVFITGDLFDGMDGQSEILVSPLRNIHAPNGTYFVTGNHETYLGVNNALAILQNTPVQILDNAVVNIAGMQILGISYPGREENHDLAAAIKKVTNFQPEKPNILLYHNPAEAIHAREAGIDLQVAGHTHRGQLFPFQGITRLIYGKYAYGLSVEGDFSIYTSTGVGTWGPAMRTSGRPEIAVISFEEA